MVPPTGLTAYIKQCIMAWWDSRPLSFLQYLPPVPNKHGEVKTYQYLLSLFARLAFLFSLFTSIYLFIFLPACFLFIFLYYVLHIVQRVDTDGQTKTLYVRIKSNHLICIRIFLFFILSTPFLHRYHDATEQNTDTHKHIFCFPHRLHARANKLCNII